MIASGRRDPNRRGTVIVVVVVLLLVTAAIAAAVLRAAIVDIRQFTVDQQALQADRLAEAGLGRAAAQLRSNPDYQGEEWIATLPGERTGKVTIRVKGSAGEKQIESVATFPEGSPRPVRSRRAANYRGP